MAQEFDLLSSLTSAPAAPAPLLPPDAQGTLPDLTPEQAAPAARAEDPAARAEDPAARAEDPAVTDFRRLFGNAPQGQLDPDTLGLVTEAEGRRLGTGWTRDTVRTLQVFDEVVPYETLQTLEGGTQLAELASRARRGKRDFLEAVSTGSWTDFVPFVGDLATMGISIKNMAKVRDSIMKMQKDGPQALTLQEKVLVKLYEEDMTRQSEQTWGATVGTIVRQAPAFAAEFLISGGLAKVGTKALGMAARESVEEAVESGARRQATKLAAGWLRQPGAEKAKLALDKLAGFDKWLDDYVVAVAKDKGISLLDDGARAALTARGTQAAEALLAAKRNPKLLREVGDMVVEYGKRGLFTHMDDVVRDLPPGVMGKLREAAGVAFIEAPVKGGLYAAFDFLAVNPVAARLAGADEAVTETELAIAETGNEELMRNAKMLAFGSAWAEYASEVSGRAFTALGGIVTEDIAGTVGRNLAVKGLRATRDFKTEGSIARRLIDSFVGPEDQLRPALAAIRRETVEAAAQAGKVDLAGKSVGQFMASDRDAVERLVRERLGFQEKSFLGYYIASKALDKGITPQAVTRTLEAMGYDDIFGEFMEERYSGFAQGLFGTDGTSDEHMGVMRRLAHAARQAVPSFKQGSAEIMAFAIPVISRAGVARAYQSLGAGTYGKMRDFSESHKMLQEAGGFFYFGAEGPVSADVRSAEEGSGSALFEYRQKLGADRLKAGNAWMLSSIDREAETLADLAPAVEDIKEDRVGLGTQAARTALGIVGAVITGNPLMAFHNPARALAQQNLGLDGVLMLNAVTGLRRDLYANELKRRAGVSAAGAREAGGEPGEEAAFDNPEIEAAIRPDVVEFSRAILRDNLRARGAVVASEKDVDGYLDKVDPKVLEAGGGRAEFKKGFEAELLAAASGRLRFDVVNGRVHTVYERPATDETVSDMTRRVETFMAGLGVSSMVDLEREARPDVAFLAMSGVPMSETDIETAAAAGKEADSPAVRKARMRLALMILSNPNMSNDTARERHMEMAGDYARLLREVNRRLLRPQFDAAEPDTDGGTRVEIRGEAGNYYAAYAKTGNRIAATGSYATVGEAAAATAGVPGLTRREAEVYFTPSSTAYLPFASMLLSRSIPGMQDYIKNDIRQSAPESHAMNPFSDTALTHAQATARVKADLDLARRWTDRRSSPFADAAEAEAAKAAYIRALGTAGENVDGTEVETDGYETAARRLAETVGIDTYQKPGQRGRAGYIFNPAAIAHEGAVYIPYRFAGSFAALIEDSVETAVKRFDRRDKNGNVVSGLFRDPRDPAKYRPAAKAFMTHVMDRLSALSSDTAADRGVSEKARREAAFLTDLFNHDKYSLEAVSHAVTAFYFLQGDAAVKGLGGGAAFYSTLGLIAHEVRDFTPVYDAFGGLVNRVFGGGTLTEAGSPLQQAVESFIPQRFRDGTDVIRPDRPDTVGTTALSETARMAVDLAKSVEDARKGETRKTYLFRNPDFSSGEHRAEAERFRGMLEKAVAKGGYFDEDLPALLDDLASSREKELADMGYEAAAKYEADEAERAASEKAASADKSVPPVSSDPGDTSASWSEEMMVGHPAFALKLGTAFLARRPGSAGDRRSLLRKIFEEFRSRDPLLPESVFLKFEAAVKDAGLLAGGKIKAEPPVPGAGAAADAGFMAGLAALDADASFLTAPADTDDEDAGEPVEDEDGDMDSREDGGAYSERAVKIQLERSPEVVLVRGVMRTHAPGLNYHDPSILRMYMSKSEDLYGEGADLSDSVMSLFDPAYWTANNGTRHPALIDQASLDAWLAKPRPENGKPMFDDLLDAFRALGIGPAFRAADKMKGFYGTDVVTAEVNTDGNAAAVSASFRRTGQSLSAEITEMLLRGAEKAPAGGAAEAAKRLAAEVESGRAGVAGRLSRLAAISDLMFGENNALGQALLDGPSYKRVSEGLKRAMVGTGTAADTQLWKLYAEVPGKTWANGGIVANQMLKAAKLLAEGRKEAAVATLLRGDVLVMATLKGSPRGNWDRGAVTKELNDAAGAHPVMSASRRGDDYGSTSKVDGTAVEKSAGAADFLNSEEFAAGFRGEYVKGLPAKAAAALEAKEPAAVAAFEKALRRGIRHAEWPGGVKVFSAFAGLERRIPADETGDEARAAGFKARDRVGQPTYEEISDIAKLDFEAGKSDVATVAIYNSEKTAERLVRIPRAALKSLTGEGAPTYAGTLAAVSRLMRITSASAKRGFVWMSEGMSFTMPAAKFGLIVAEDPAARENLHGELFVTDADAASYYRMQGFGSTVKHIFTHAPGKKAFTLASKGQMILADGKYPPGARSAAFTDFARIGQAAGALALTDLDSYKEGPLAYKAADGRKAYELVLSGETEAEVKAPDGTAAKVSDIVKSESVEVVEEKVNGRGVKVIFSSPAGGIRSQWASAPGKKAQQVDSEMPVDKIMNNPAVQPYLNAQSLIRRAFADREDVSREIFNAAVEALPDAARRLLDAGVSEFDPQIRAVLGPKLAAAAAKAVKPVYRHIQMVAQNHDGARVIDVNGVPAPSDPFGGMEELPGGLIRDAYVDEKSGVRVPASTAANIGHGAARYGLRAVAAKLGVAEGDDAAAAREIARRVTLLKAAERESQAKGDDGIFLSAYVSLVDGCFADHLGRPLQPGQILSFSDLVDGDGKFDISRVSHVTGKDGKRFTFLGGQLGLGSRTPADKGRRGEYFFSVAAPAYMEEADGETQKYRAVAMRGDGTLYAESVPYPKGTLVAGSDAVVKLTPQAKWLAGSDEDWDKLDCEFLAVDGLGRAAAPVDAEDAARAVAAATGETLAEEIRKRYAERIEKNPAGAAELEARRDAEIAKAPAGEARRIMDGAVAGLEVKSFQAQVKLHRDPAYRPLEAPVGATPFSPAYQAKLPKYVSPALGSEGAAVKATQNKDAGKARGISTAVVASYKAMLDNGIYFTDKAPWAYGPDGEPLSALAKPEGAASPFWKRGFTARDPGGWSPEQISAYVLAAEGIKNATFDDLKEALAYRAGFRVEFLDLYLALLFESGVASQEEYEEFHDAYLEWMRGPHGTAVAKAFANERYPGKNGGAEYRRAVNSTRASLLREAKREESDASDNRGTPYHFRAFNALLPRQRQAVAAVVESGTAAGLPLEAAYAAALPVAQAYLRLNAAQSVGRVLMYKKASFAFPDKIAAAERTLERVQDFVRDAGTPKGRIGFGEARGRSNLAEALREYGAVIRSAKEALRGSVEMSPLYLSAVDAAVSGALPDGFDRFGMDRKEAARRAANTLIPWEAAYAMTPAKTAEKIGAALGALTEAGGGKTPAFLGLTESVLAGIFRGYAANLAKGGESNAALNLLLTPSTESGAKRITLTGTDGTALAKENFRKGLEALRDGTAGIPAFELKVPPAKDADKVVWPAFSFDTADAYWMLMQYAALTAEKTLETGRVQQSLLPLFGDEVYRMISDHQTAALRGTGNSELLLRWAEANIVDANGRPVRKPGDLIVPAAFENVVVRGAEKPAPAEEPAPAEKEVPGFAEAYDAKAAETMEIPAPAAETGVSRPSEIRRQLGAYATAVAAAPQSSRGLANAAAHGRGWLAKATDATRKQASAMGFALSRAAELPWVSSVPGAAENMSAAAGILADLGYAEPAVFLGALRACGRAAVSSGARESVDAFAQLLLQAGAAQSTDADRLDAARKSAADLLSKPARVRVMEFAVVSEPGFRGGADTAAVAAGILRAIEPAEGASLSLGITGAAAEFSRSLGEVASGRQVASVERALIPLPKALRDRVRVVARAPRFIGRRVDYAKKAWLQERGIDDPVLALWIERNEKAIGLKNLDTKDAIIKAAAERLGSRIDKLEAAAKKEDADGWEDNAESPLTDAVAAWCEIIQLSPALATDGATTEEIARLAYLDLLMDVAEAGMAEGREDKYVEYPSKVAVEALWDYMHKFPSDRFNIAKKYAALKNEKVLGSVETKPSVSGKGTWAVVPRTDPDQADFKMNAAKLRELSPSTWCTHDSMTEEYLSSYDNHILMVNGKAVAGIEVYPDEYDGDPGKRRIHEVTSYANNGVATVDYLDDVLAYIRANNWDENDEAGSIQNAKEYKAQGKTDADVANIHRGHWRPMADRDPQFYPDYFFEDDLTDDEMAEATQAADLETQVIYESLLRQLTYDAPDGGEEVARAEFSVPGKVYSINYTGDGAITDYLYEDDLGIHPVSREAYLAAYQGFLREQPEQPERPERPGDAELLPFSKGARGVEGFYDPTADKAVLVAANIGSDARAREVALHETAHRGLHSLARAVGGDKELLKVLSSAEAELMKAAPELVKKTGHKNLEALVRDYGFDPASEAGRLRLLSELAARWAERFESRPQESWWTKLIGAVRDWVKKFTGVTLDERGVDELIKGVVRLGTRPREEASLSLGTTGTTGTAGEEVSPDLSAAADPRTSAEALMSGDDRRAAARMADSAIGSVPARKETPDTAAKLAGLIRRADDEIRGFTAGDRELDGFAAEMKREYRREAGPRGAIRKVFEDPEGVAALAPVFLRAGRPALAGLAGHLRGLIGEIESARWLGEELKGALVNPLGMFFKPGTGRAEMIDLARLPGAVGRLGEGPDGSRGLRYGELLAKLGNMSARAVSLIRKARADIAGLSGAEFAAASAELEKAVMAFMSGAHLARAAAVALRPTLRIENPGEPGRPVTVINPLRAEFLAEENQDFTPPAGAEPMPGPTPEEHQDINPETGHTDPWTDYNITFTTSQAWFEGTVLPDFRGIDVRSILFDKEQIAAATRAVALSNAIEAKFGLDSDTGQIRPVEEVEGLKGGKSIRYGRRTLVRELRDIQAGRAFSDDEYDLANFFAQAVYHYMGDGGARARIATAGRLQFGDLPWKGIARMTPEQVSDLVSYAEASRRRNEAGAPQVKAIHETLLRAKENLPAAIFPRVETALAKAVYEARLAEKPAEAALLSLERDGFALARRRRGEDGTASLYSAVLSAPVALVDEIFQKSTAKDKLIGQGRKAEDLTMEGNAAELKAEFDSLTSTFKAMGWAANGDARMFSDIGTAAPFMKGTGAWRYHARKLGKPVAPGYSARVAELYEGLKKSAGSFTVRRRGAGGNWENFEKTGAEAAADGYHAGMFMLLKDLLPGTFGPEVTSAAEVWAVIAQGRAAGEGLSASSTGWDIAKAVYRLSVAKVHDVAWNGGTVGAARIDTAGLEAFNRLIGEESEARGEGPLPGAAFSDIYDSTGALPQNLTAGQALAAHARQLSEAVRYRAAVNQMLMTADEDGMPLIVAKPSSLTGDDTVPDRIWAALARWWADSYADKRGAGVFYDESASGRDNARRLYDLIAPGKTAEGGERRADGGVRRYVWTNVEVPPGMPTFEAVSAAKDPAGDDTKSRVGTLFGGEAANIAKQIFAVAGYGREDTKNTRINHILSWSKSASVMCSLFFPIATAFESPAAAVGMGATLSGLTKTGSDFARWAQENHGWIAKALGVKDLEGAPFMADILRVIGSDDPALVELKVQAQLSGLSLADRSRNMLDTDRTLIAKDIKAAADRVKAMTGSSRAARSVKALLEGAMEHSSEFAFEYVINATKLATFAQLNARMRRRALDAGRWWDPVRDMKKWSNYINAEVGGIDPAMYPWMTPQMQQWLRMAMFSWEWTLGAWEAGGGGVISQKLFGTTTNPAIRGFMPGRWARMYFGVMVGIPVAMQLLVTALAKAAGDDDDKDKWFSWQNEKGRAWSDFDITPLLRMAANAPAIPSLAAAAGLAGLLGSPAAGAASAAVTAGALALSGFAGKTVGDVKTALPESVLGLPVGALIPGATGEEGQMASTRRRRYYMHFGKQGWEVAGWFTNPTGSFLSKMSMPAQRVLEGVLGITPSMGWDKEWKDLGFWERWTSLDPDKSALLNLTGAFVPFSVMGAQRAPEAGLLTAVGPVGKGMSKTRAEKEMAAMFKEWGDAETFIARHKGKPGAYTDLAAFATEWLEALRLNGYNPETSLKNALAEARKPLYARIHEALPRKPGMAADKWELEAAARGLYRLDFVGKNLYKSIRSRDKNQNVKRVDELARSTDEALRSAFSDPYGKRG